MEVQFIIIFFASILTIISAHQHCPALSINFSDFDIPFCAPSFTIQSSNEVEPFLKGAKCVGWGTWTTDKSIGCSSPVVPENVVLEYPCMCDFGGFCKVKCKPGFTLEGKVTIQCLNDGSWSALPSCTEVKCVEPNLPPEVTFNGPCQYTEGQACKVKCLDPKYQLEGPESITCNSKTWSAFPKCILFCQYSDMPNELEENNQCSGKEGSICPVTCKDKKLTHNGPPNINCLKTGKWSEFPTCGCSATTIPSNILLKNACKMKAGELCEGKCADTYFQQSTNSQLVCAVNGSWDISASIKCLKVCPEPILPDGLHLVGKCSRKEGEECKVSCDDASKMLVGQDTFTCYSSGLYSPMPGCAKVDTCPESLLPDRLIFGGSCNRNLGETCFLICKDPMYKMVGSNSITCQSSGVWTTFPKCERNCGNPSLPSNSKLVGSCNTTEGSSCTIECEDKYTIQGSEKIRCTSEGTWTKLPECVMFCSAPVLPSGVFLASKCTGEVGDSCFVTCQDDSFILEPYSEITCEPSGIWSVMPKCWKKCNKPLLPKGAEISGTCGYVENQPCNVECTDRKAVLKGSPQISCKDSGEWTEFPKCVRMCDEPSLPRGIEFLRPCNREVMTNCDVACHTSTTLVGPKFITCQENGKWSEFPECATVCPDPELNTGTFIKGFCSKKHNSKCIVACKSPTAATKLGKTEQPIMCYQGTWTTLPSCVEVCDPPNLPSGLKLVTPCDRKIGRHCTILCENSGTIKGSPTIRCQNSRTWTEFPTCERYCGAPFFTQGLSFATTCDRKVEHSCPVKCDSPWLIEGPPIISCLNTLNWSKFPKCVASCVSSYIPPALKIEGFCNFKAGEKCKVACSDSTKELSGTPDIECTDKGVWSKLPECVAKAQKCPSLPPHLEFTDNCPLKAEVGCLVKCSETGMVVKGSNVIVCGKDHQWKNMPNCVSKNALKCDPLISKPPLTVYCDNKPKYPGAKCRVTCQTGFNKVGSRELICGPSGNWSGEVDCVKFCTFSELERNGLEVLYQYCKARSKYCSVKCKSKLQYLEKDSAAVCEKKGGEWSYIPSCATTPRPICAVNLPPYLRVYPGCRFTTSQVCGVECKEKYDYIIGPHTIACLPSGEMSEFPKCVPKTRNCGNPVPPENIEVVSCVNFYEHGTCKVKCKNPTIKEERTITCLYPDWWEWPKC